MSDSPAVIIYGRKAALDGYEEKTGQKTMAGSLPVALASDQSQVSTKLDGYSVGPLPVMLVSPTRVRTSTSIDGYSTGPFPATVRNQVSTRLDGYSTGALPVQITNNLLKDRLDGYSIGPLPVMVVSPNRAQTSIDGYSVPFVPVKLVSPNRVGTSLDGYSVGRLPTFARIDGYSTGAFPTTVRNQVSTRLDGYSTGAIPVRISNNLLKEQLDGYSIGPLPVMVVSPNRTKTSLDGYSVAFTPVKIVSPNRVGTSVDGYSTGAFPTTVRNQVSTKLDGYSIGPLPIRSMTGSVVRLIDAYGNNVAIQDAFNWSATQPGVPAMGKDSTSSPVKLRELACNAQGYLITTSASSGASLAGLSFGQVVLSATTPAPVRSQAYTEQSSNAQRSLVSSSANDAAAGTGARTIRITYYTSALVGPKTETVTLNGTTPVNTANSDICYIERMEVVTAGASAIVPVGAVSLKAATAGAGVTVWSIAAGEGRTFGAHHYVQAGMSCHITGFEGGIKGADTAGFYLKAADLTTPGSPGFELQISETLRAPSSGNTPIRTFGTPVEVSGPARVTLYAAPDSTSSRTYYGSFDFYEQ